MVKKIIEQEGEKARSNVLLSTILVDLDRWSAKILDSLDQSTRTMTDRIDRSTAAWKNILWSCLGGFVLALALTFANVIQWSNLFGSMPPSN